MHDQRNLTQDAILRAQIAMANRLIAEQVFMALQPANAQSYRLSEHGRFHGYVTWPLYCGIAKCPDSWANALNGANKQTNSRAKKVR